MARESVDALYIPNPKSNPQNLKKTPVTSEIRGFDLAKRSIKNYLPLCVSNLPYVVSNLVMVAVVRETWDSSVLSVRLT